MPLLLFKSLHIVGFVAWFAGLFYLVRIFVYHAEAMAMPEPDRSILLRQFQLMEGRVYRIICNPAAVLTWLCGLAMLHLHGLDWLRENWWMHLKLILLALLTAYHFFCKNILEKLHAGQAAYSSFQYRLLNEVPTLLLVPIVLLAVYRNGLHIGYALAGIAGFGFLLFALARLYKFYRKKKANKP